MRRGLQAGFGRGGIDNIYHAIPDLAAGVMVEQASAAGLRYFDTAPHYGSADIGWQLVAPEGRRADRFSTVIARSIMIGMIK